MAKFNQFIFFCFLLKCVNFSHLAGTIGNEPELIESRSSKDKLATAGFFGRGSTSKQNDTYPATPQPPGSTVPPHPPTTDENVMFGKLFT